MCTVLLPPGVNPIAIIKIYHIISHHKLHLCFAVSMISVYLQTHWDVTHNWQDSTRAPTHVRKIKYNISSNALRSVHFTVTSLYDSLYKEL